MEITKFKSQVSVVLEQVSAYFQKAENRFNGLKRRTADGVQKVLCECEIGLRKIRGSSHDTIVFANGKISRFTSQVSVSTKQPVVHLESAQNTLDGLKRRTADRLQKVLCECENGLRKIRGSSRDAIVFANGKIARFASQVSVSTKKIMVHLQSAQNTLNGLKGRTADRLQKVLRECENGLRKIRGSSHDAIVFANGKTSRFASQVSVSTKQFVVHLQRAQNTVTTLGRSVIEKPRRLREARWAKEDELQNLLMDSSCAIVVTDGDRRLVEANPTALDLFGISEFNMSKFTIDAFLIHDRNSDSEGNSLPFRRPAERQGQCKIRRLDGGLLVAECIFVADVLPHRYLYKFLNAAPHRITLLGFAGRRAVSHPEDGRKPTAFRPQCDKASQQAPTTRRSTGHLISVKASIQKREPFA